MSFKTVIFDLDGTLLNTLEDLTDSLNFALDSNGCKMHSIDEVRFMVGSGIKVLIERAIPDMIYFDRVYNSFLIHYEKNKTNKTRLYDGIIEMIETLYNLNIKMAIVSNKYQDGVSKLCEQMFGKYINVSIGEQEGIAKKPAKDMVEKALELLHSNKDDAVYVGDSDIDVYTANNSSIPCIGVSWGFRGRAFLESLKATYVVDNTTELIEIVKGEKE